MDPAAPVLLLILLGLRGVLPVPVPVPELQPGTGRCSGTLCAFGAPVDFTGAETGCRNSSGSLLGFGSEERLLDSLRTLSGISGTFWLRGPGRRSEEAAAGLQTCPSVTVSGTVSGTGSVTGSGTVSGTGSGTGSVEWRSCSDRLGGFLCEFGDVCSGTGSSGAPVTYTTYGGFTVSGSESFPAGTTAERREPGGGLPVSKHVCFSSRWTEAPWNCDVMRGGCESGCDKRTNTCTCPPGRALHPNQVSCTCAEGFRLGGGGSGCVDVDECAEEDPCAAEGRTCTNLQGGFTCECMEDFVWEDGACVNVSVCHLCEHTCDKIDGEYRCVCGRGFRVSPVDVTKCDAHCTQRDCPARCQEDAHQEQKEQQQCFCPDGYVVDIRDGNTTCTDIDECAHQEMCEQRCENLFGGFRCRCDDGFRLQDGFRCVPEDPGEVGSGSGESVPPAASRPAPPLPSYVRTGSVLGIAVFLLLVLVLVLVLVGFIVRHAVRRCGKFEVSPLKRPEISIFYLQQVNTETYKRLSIDQHQ